MTVLINAEISSMLIISIRLYGIPLLASYQPKLSAFVRLRRRLVRAKF